ncbi:MAG: hypothetical protein ACQKBU_05970, partial [Verrucomicrobiales bacterium]
DSQKLKAAAIVVVAIFLALYLGVSVATAQFETVAWVVGVATLLICALMGHRIWMLIPLLGSLNFTLAVPGSPSTTQLSQILVIGFSFMLFLMRRLPFRLRVSEIEVWCFITLFCVVQVYLRNPVGLNIMGASAVGARPYAYFALTFMAAFLFLGLRVNERDLKWLFPLTVTGGCLGFAMSVFGYFVPSIGAYYGAVNVTGDRQIVRTGAEQATRVGFLGNFARNLALWIAAKVSPLRASFHPLWLMPILIAFACAAGSGYRNVLAYIGLTFLAGIFYRDGLKGLIISAIVGIVALISLVLLNSIVSLPLNAQRALSFLPGNWDSRVVRDAENSTDWRVDMWKEALFTENWIENKVLGDGLGMSAREVQWIGTLKATMMNSKLREGDLTLQQEIMMASGDYHSGPVHLVRVIGYVGLILVLLAMFRIAVHGHRQILRARGTSWYPLALLIGIPTIVSPLYFVFVFGSFAGAMGIVLTGGSMVRLLENNMPR